MYKFILNLAIVLALNTVLFSEVPAKDTLYNSNKVSSNKQTSTNTVKKSSGKTVTTHNKLPRHNKSKHSKKGRGHSAKRHNADYTDGIASYYAPKFKGRKTTSGVRFNPSKFTGAHPTFAMGTEIIVTNLSNGKVVYVVVNDRMPKKSGHVIDLTTAAAKQIGIYGHGLGHVKLAKVDHEEFEVAMEQQEDGEFSQPVKMVHNSTSSDSVSEESESSLQESQESTATLAKFK